MSLTPELRTLACVVGKELRSALRDRNIVLYSLVVPLVLYPVLLLLSLELLSYALGRAERLVVHVGLGDDTPELAALRSQLSREPNVVVSDLAAETALKEGRLDALVMWQADAFRLLYHGGRESSRIARERLREAVEELRSRRLQGVARRLGMAPEAAQGLVISQVNVAGPGEKGRRLLDGLGVLVVAMTFLGALYPAVEMTAGERERGGWEALLATRASRRAIAAAKYLATAVFALTAALANLAGVVLASHFILVRLGFGSAGLDVPWRAWPVSFLAILALALLASAATLAVALYAKSYREAQAVAGPVVALAILPVWVGLMPGVELGYRTALIPIANLTLLFRDAMRGRYAWGPMAVTLIVVLAASLVIILLAARKLDPERLLTEKSGRGVGLLTRLRAALGRTFGS